MPAFYKSTPVEAPAYYYQCPGEYQQGGSRCRTIPGRTVDRAIVEAMLARLSPPSLQEIREAMRQAQADEQREARIRHLELEHARQHIAALEERCLAVDPTNRHVLQVLDRELAEALREARRIESTTVSSRITFDDKAFGELVELCSDLAGLWAATTTTNSDRKELARTMIDNVVVEGCTTELIRLRVEWTDGELPTPVEVARPPYCHRVIGELADQGLDAREISARLADLRLRTAKGRVWNAELVARVITQRRNPRTAGSGGGQ